MQGSLALVLPVRDAAAAGPRTSRVDLPAQAGTDASTVRFREMLASVQQKTPEERLAPPENGAGPQGRDREEAVSGNFSPPPEEAPPKERPTRTGDGQDNARTARAREEDSREEAESRARRRERADELVAGAIVSPQVDFARKRLAAVSEARESLARVKQQVRVAINQPERDRKLPADLESRVMALLGQLAQLVKPERLDALKEQFAGVKAERHAAAVPAGSDASGQAQLARKLAAFAKALPDAKELDALMEKAARFLEQGPAGTVKSSQAEGSMRRRGESRSAPVRGDRADPEKTQAIMAEVRDQRINDPKSLRETIRIVRREPAAEGRVAQGRAEMPGAVPPPEVQAVPPVAAPKATGQGALFLQHDFSAGVMAETKKVSAPDQLRNPREIVRQVVERASLTVKSGMTEMHVQLNPRDMGRIGMHFSLSADGEMTARLVASNDNVRQYLQDNLASFSRDLADAGVSLARIEVAVDNGRREFGRESSGADRDGQAGRQDGSALAGTGAAGASVSAGHAGPVRHDGVVDIRA